MKAIKFKIKIISCREIYIREIFNRRFNNNNVKFLLTNIFKIIYVNMGILVRKINF